MKITDPTTKTLRAATEDDLATLDQVLLAIHRAVQAQVARAVLTAEGFWGDGHAIH